MTNLFEIYIIELPKCKIDNSKNENLISWIKFLKNPENMGENDMSEEIREAKKCLERISKDEEEIRWAELREKYILEINTAKAEAREEAYEEGKEEGLKDGREKGMKEGRAEGRAEGRVEGITEGMKEGKIQGENEAKKTIARNMLNFKIDIETISKITGLTKEEIKKINKNN